MILSQFMSPKNYKGRFSSYKTLLLKDYLFYIPHYLLIGHHDRELQKDKKKPKINKEIKK